MLRAGPQTDQHPIPDDIVAEAFETFAEPFNDSEHGLAACHDQLARIQRHLEANHLPRLLNNSRSDRFPGIKSTRNDDQMGVIIDYFADTWNRVFDELEITDSVMVNIIARTHRNAAERLGDDSERQILTIPVSRPRKTNSCL